MSEYYSLRRSTIKDTTAFIAFVVGWLGSAPIAWPHIKGGFENGDVTAGVFRFAVVVFGVALACGAAGLGLGAAGGWAWERAHRKWRVTHPPVENAPAAWASVTREREQVSALPALPPIVYDDRPINATVFAALAQRTAGEAIDKKRATRALKVTLNIGAWDGDRLIGIARVLTDEYLVATLAQIAVDPDYQRRGVGRELMNRAFNATPRGMLLAAVPVGASAFFDRIGCERGLAGFTMRRPARQTPRS